MSDMFFGISGELNGEFWITQLVYEDPKYQVLIHSILIHDLLGKGEKERAHLIVQTSAGF